MYFRIHRTKYTSIDELQKCIDSTLADTLDKGPWEFKVVIVRWKNRVKFSKAITYTTVKSLFHVLQTVDDRVTFYEIVPAGTDKTHERLDLLFASLDLLRQENDFLKASTAPTAAPATSPHPLKLEKLFNVPHRASDQKMVWHPYRNKQTGMCLGCSGLPCSCPLIRSRQTRQTRQTRIESIDRNVCRAKFISSVKDKDPKLDIKREGPTHLDADKVDSENRSTGGRNKNRTRVTKHTRGKSYRTGTRLVELTTAELKQLHTARRIKMRAQRSENKICEQPAKPRRATTPYGKNPKVEPLQQYKFKKNPQTSTKGNRPWRTQAKAHVGVRTPKGACVQCCPQN